MRYSLAAVTAAFLGLSCLEPGAHTQRPYQDPKKPPFVLESGTYGMKEFLLKCTSHLGWNLLLEESDFQNPNNKIEIQMTITVDTKGCEEVLTNLMFVKDFAIVPVDVSKKIYQAIFIRGPKRPMIMTSARFMSPLEVKQHAKMAIPVVTALRLKHISASKATASVRPFLAGGGVGASAVQIGTAGNEEMVLLQGFANQVAQAMRLFEEVDQPGQRPPLAKSVLARLAEVEKRLARLEKAATKERK